MDSFSLGFLAETLHARLQGDAKMQIHSLAALEKATAKDISYFADERYLKQLASSKAGVIITADKFVDQCPAAGVLIVDNPKLTWAHLLRFFYEKKKRPTVIAGIHPTAMVADPSQIAASATIGAYCVLDEGVSVGERSVIAANCHLGYGASIGDDCCLHAGVTLYHEVRVGDRLIVHAGAVIGADGFGNVQDEHGHWIKLPHLGAVVIGNDVEIGANTTIDRGAIEDSVIEDGVRIDNLVYIGHNVTIGAHTAIAAGSLVAGSAKIGQSCMIGGGCSIAGHLEIVSGVLLTATSAVSKSILKPGVYSSGQPVQANHSWRKSVIYYRQLDQIVARIKKIGESQ